MVDGYATEVGEFCLEVTNVTPLAITNIEDTNIRLFPNPTTGAIQLTDIQADQVQVFDNLGRLVLSEKQPGTSIDISNVTAGLYFIKLYEGEEVYVAKVIKK